MSTILGNPNPPAPPRDQKDSTPEDVWLETEGFEERSDADAYFSEKFGSDLLRIDQRPIKLSPSRRS